MLMMGVLIQQFYRANLHLSKNSIFTLSFQALTADSKESLLVVEQAEQRGIHQTIIRLLFR